MPRNGSGTFSLYTPGNPVVTGTTISSTWANNTLNDLATGLTNSLSKDGQTTPTANLPMGTFKLTGLGAGSAATDSLNLTQAQNEAYQLIGTIAGTNTITGSLTPNLTAYAAGQTFRFVSAGANTGAVTLNIDGLGAKSVTKNGVTALVAGDIPASAAVEVIYDGTRFQIVNEATVAYELLATYTASSSAQIDITEGFDGNYSSLEFVFENILPATNAVSFQARISTDGGASFLTTATYFSSLLVNVDATATAASTNSANAWSINGGTSLSNTANETLNGILNLFNPGIAARCYTNSLVTYRTSAGNNSVCLRGNFTTNTSINAIRFLMSSGNIASGKIYVYGRRK